jgi:uncharacterized coiled-coil DUF342 family protein
MSWIADLLIALGSGYIGYNIGYNAAIQEFSSRMRALQREIWELKQQNEELKAAYVVSQSQYESLMEKYSELEEQMKEILLVLQKLLGISAQKGVPVQYRT